MKKVCLLLFLFFIHITLTACGTKQESVSSKPPEEKPPAYGDILVRGDIGDASNLIPILASDSASHNIAGMIYNGLVKYDKNMNIVGDLAESWDISSNGLVITFHLRKGIKWHDGKPFTSADVLYTYQATIDPKTPTAYAGDFLKVKKVEAPDDYTFRATYEKPFAPALISWSSAILPRHLLAGKDITQSSLSRHPIGTGPYMFREWVAGQKIVLVSNPDYFDGQPYIDGRMTRIIPDTATMFLELRAQNIGMMGLTPLQYTRQTENNLFKNNFNKYRYLSFAYTFMGYNLKNPLFADKRVRQAISYAINKDEIISGVLLKLGKPASGPYKPGTWAFNDKVKVYNYNPQKALALLNEAGWKKTGSEGLLKKDGQPFIFEIVTNQGNETRQKCAEIIQRQLKEIGITVKIRVLEWSAFVTDFINKRRFDAVILGWTIPLDPDAYDVWHSSKTAPEELNFISYNNPEVDEMLEKGRSTFDQKERKKYYDRFQEILAEDQPYTFLYVPEALVIINKRFRGIEPAPIGLEHNFIKWYVPKDEQKYTLTR
ncbi:MAG TPA: peptide-binding protein [Smithella sp.]|nr:peptide-binding protein [Smithella sp.]